MSKCTIKETNNDFSVKITADVKNEDQKNFIEALGHMVIANISLKDNDDKLLNNCINLLNKYSKEVLTMLANYVDNNDIKVKPSIRKRLEPFISENNFTL